MSFKKSTGAKNKFSQLFTDSFKNVDESYFWRSLKAIKDFFSHQQECKAQIQLEEYYLLCISCRKTPLDSSPSN